MSNRQGLDPDDAANGLVAVVPVASLQIAGSPRTSGEDQEHVQSLVDSETELPPIVVHRQTMRVIDGAHRLRAARLRNEQHIKVRYFEGSEANAFVLAVRANITHGLPLSLADRTSAAIRIIKSHPGWSDRMIASTAGIAARTVARIRNEHAPELPSENVRIGQDGRARPVDGARRRALASDLIAENPDLSLRQIAQAAELSPETVRDVRNRLLYGRKPSTPRDRARRSTSYDPMSTKEYDEIITRLKADPALKQTDTGRALLRVLHAQKIAQEDWEKIIDNLPAHCSSSVARAAEECARIWSYVADRVKDSTSDKG